MRLLKKVLKWTGLGLLCLVGLILLFAGSEALRSIHYEARPAEPAETRDSLQSAVFADGKLWLFYGSGHIATIRPGAMVKEDVLPEHKRDGEPYAFAMISYQGRPTILTCDWTEPSTLVISSINEHNDTSLEATASRTGCPTFFVKRWENGAWKTLDSFPVGKHELPVNFVADDNGITVMTMERIITHKGATQQEFTLPEPINVFQRRGYTLFTTADAVYVAHDWGEFGGGLQRLDWDSGAFTWVGDQTEDKDPEIECSRLLNRRCDAVTGLIPAPWNSKCLLASVGIHHFQAFGRIVEICGEKIRKLYSRPYGSVGQVFNPSNPFDTVGFFGLARDGDKVLAAGSDGLYSINQRGVARIRNFPERRERVGDTSVSFFYPGAALVWTDWRRSVSLGGPAPMLVPRPN